MIQPFPIGLFNKESVVPTATPTPTATSTPTPTATATPTPTPEPSIPTSGLLMWVDTTNASSWDGSSSTLTDLSGNGNDFTISGGTATTLGGIPVVSLDGAGSAEIVGPTLGVSHTTYSWFVIVNPNVIGSYDGYVFVRRAPGDANGIGTFSTTGRFDIVVNNGTEITMPIGNTDVITGNWNLLGSGIGDTTYYNLNYRDVSGTPTKTVVSGAKSSGSATFDFPIVLGHDREPGGDRNMNGYITAAAMWDRTLSETEWDDVITYYLTRISF
jgi:hypothetical protein